MILLREWIKSFLHCVRCMFLGFSLPKSLQGKVVNIVIYMINMTLLFALKFKTSMEVWRKKIANYNIKRVFNTLVFAHVKKDKLKAWVERYIFIGCAEGVKRYKLWRLEPRKVRCFIIKDTTFDEIRIIVVYRNLEKGKEKAHVEVESSSLEQTI